MELIDRYLHAVKFWLPKGQADDIIAELSEDMQAQLEERESAVGRKLTTDEVADFLRQRGRPVLVANRYLPQEHLIGPVLFPIYKFVLKIVALCYLVPGALVWPGIALAGPAARRAHDFQGWVSWFGSLWSWLWLTAFVSAGVVTIVFACLERAEAKSHFMESWDPRKLPPVRNSRKISRASAGFELAVNLAFGVWWAMNVSSAVVLHRPFARIVLSGLWPTFFWGFLALTAANVVLASASLTHPYWTAWRATWRLAIDGAGAALFCWLLGSNIVAAIAAPDVTPERAQDIVNAINLWAARMVPVGVVVGVIVLVFDAFRIWRVKTADFGTAGRQNGPETGPSACAEPLP
jgi:hypothetical protein